MDEACNKSRNRTIIYLVIMMKLKRFDVYTKANMDDVYERTVFGAFSTILCIVIVGLLIFSEFSNYLRSDFVTHMILDTSVGGGRIADTKIDFDVTFHSVACDRVTFLQEITRGQHHGAPHEEGSIIKQENAEGCNINGYIITDKIGGNFKLQVAPTESDAPDKADILGRNSPNLLAPDLSHTVHKIHFHDISPGNSNTSKSLIYSKTLTNPLTDRVNPIPLGVGIHQYGIQVVPTTYAPLKTSASHMNQYSVTEKQADFDQVLQGVTISGQYYFDFVGVVFNYDFYPVKLISTEEHKGSIFEFLAGLCGIVGGVVTILG